MRMHRTYVVGGSMALLALLLAWRGCASGDSQPATVAPTPAPAANAGQGGSPAAAEAAARAARERHVVSMRAAVATLQRYLAALGEDQALADTYWVGGRPPERSGEADLRSLTDLRALRIENGTPTPLDSLAPPDAVEIPVELRISTRNAPLRRYHGWYRLRRTGDGWRITSAAIDASPPRR